MLPENIPKARSKITFPSPIEQVKIRGMQKTYTIRIPKNDLFRVKNIFQQHEYSTHANRNKNGPKLVLDIGANVGLYTVYMKFIDPLSVIYCFEPSVNTLTLLRKNVAELPRVHILPYGLFNKDYDADLNIHQFNTGENSMKFKNAHYSGYTKVKLKDAGAEIDN